jgi:hypothetical protein
MTEIYKTIPMIFALAEASGRRQTSTPSRRALEEIPSLHHCLIQKSTIAIDVEAGADGETYSPLIAGAMWRSA